jgi:phosphatidylglycerophosphate synthase
MGADSYSGLEKLILGPFRQGLRAALWPAIWTLAKLGVPPNAVSLAQLPLGVGIVLLIEPAPRAASALFVFTLLVDGIDGALARHTGKASDYGALVDQVSDHVREITVVAGLAFVGGLNGGLAALYGIAYPLLNFLLYLGASRGVRAPLALKTWLTFYPFLFLFLWTGTNWLDYAAIASVTAMGLVSGWVLWQLSHRFEVSARE